MNEISSLGNAPLYTTLQITSIVMADVISLGGETDNLLLFLDDPGNGCAHSATRINLCANNDIRY